VSAGAGASPPAGAGAAAGAYRALAPAKVNLGLFVGPVRAGDARHELVSVMQSISLADELTLEPAPPAAAADQLVCPGVPGEPQQNLAARALAAFRAATGWQAPPQRLTVEKRIPVAAGLGGGSADAAAALRLARHASGLGDERLLRELGAELGADVPAQVSPGRWLATGAGERLQALPDPLPTLELLVLPCAAGLATADVYAVADQLGLARERRELEQMQAHLTRALELGAPLPAARELLHNDLQQAALSLLPELGESLAAVADAGAELALLSGSGPTVLGLFAHANAAGRVRRALLELSDRDPVPLAASSVGAAFGAAVEL
jgi:4-diphosphocytidyl-2-C-methyl-D-erythritol kinase